VKIVCPVGGDIFARVVQTEYGPTLIRNTGGSGNAFRRRDGQSVGRWALGQKDGERLEAVRFRLPIALREPRLYGPGETSDPIAERTSGTADAWCDRCGSHHDLDIADLYRLARSGRREVLVSDEAVG
jgi:hypothetical protein